MKNDDFQEGKMVADGRFLGGDPTKNCNFQRRKVGLLCSKIFQRFLWGRCWRNDRFWKSKITWPLIIFDKSKTNFEISWGRCDWKWRFSQKEIAFGMVQKFFSRFMLGAMRLKMTIFIEGNSLCRVAKIFQPFYVGGDATENDDFQRGKQCLQGYKKFSASIQRFSEFRDSLNSEILWFQRFSDYIFFMENVLKFTKSVVHKFVCFLKNKHLILRASGPNPPLSQQTTRLRNWFAIPNLSLKKDLLGLKD